MEKIERRFQSFGDRVSLLPISARDYFKARWFIQMNGFSEEYQVAVNDLDTAMRSTIFQKMSLERVASILDPLIYLTRLQLDALEQLGNSKTKEVIQVEEILTSAEDLKTLTGRSAGIKLLLGMRVGLGNLPKSKGSSNFKTISDLKRIDRILALSDCINYLHALNDPPVLKGTNR